MGRREAVSGLQSGSDMMRFALWKGHRPQRAEWMEGKGGWRGRESENRRAGAVSRDCKFLEGKGFALCVIPFSSTRQELDTATARFVETPIELNCLVLRPGIIESGRNKNRCLRLESFCLRGVSRLKTELRSSLRLETFKGFEELFGETEHKAPVSQIWPESACCVRSVQMRYLSGFCRSS